MSRTLLFLDFGFWLPGFDWCTDNSETMLRLIFIGVAFCSSLLEYSKTSSSLFRSFSPFTFSANIHNKTSLFRCQTSTPPVKMSKHRRDERVHVKGIGIYNLLHKNTVKALLDVFLNIFPSHLLCSLEREKEATFKRHNNQTSNSSKPLYYDSVSR